MTYTKWLKTLEEFKKSSKENTFEGNGLKMSPANGALQTVEIKSLLVVKGSKECIYVNREQAKSIVLYLGEIFEL